MSIRHSVILLAVLTGLSIFGVLSREWGVKNLEIDAAEHELTTIIEIRAISNIVHLIQQERGLTGGYLVGQDKNLPDHLLKQREIIDEFLVKTRNIFNLNMFQQDIYLLKDELNKVREQIDQRKSDWGKIRTLYTKWITTLIDKTRYMEDTNLPADLVKMVGMIKHLAVSRENLGQIRAIINRFYTRKTSNQSELYDLSINFGAYLENVRVFRQEVPKNGAIVFEKIIDSDTHRQVINQIKKALSPTGLEYSSREVDLWWGQITQTIDSMKHLETILFTDLEDQLQEQITHKRHDLFVFSLASIVVLFVVLSLTFYIVYRMLKAVSILMNSLQQVIRTEDFAVRLPYEKKDEFGDINHSINSLLGYTEQIIHQKDILANTDLLTGLPNRRTILEIAEREIKRDNRYGGGMAVMLCDIDHFKQVNDQHGHDVGDKVLKQFSRLLQKNVRESDTAGRWGGEEFLILVSSGSAEESKLLAEKLRKQVESLKFPPLKSLTCSIGVSLRNGKEGFESMCKRADEALYGAKIAGRNQVIISEIPE